MMTDLGALRWPEVHRSVLLLPLGSCEQHGPHLPLDTDTRIAVAVARAVAASRQHVVVAPPLTYGASGEHAGFSGTLSLGTSALCRVLVELVRSADWAESVVFVNGHGGNLDGVRAAAAELGAEGRPVRVWSPVIPGGDAHAGHTETSLMLALTTAPPVAVATAPPAVPPAVASAVASSAVASSAVAVGPPNQRRDSTTVVIEGCFTTPNDNSCDSGSAAPADVRMDRAEPGAMAPIRELLPALRAGGVISVSLNGVLGDPTGASAEEGHRILTALVASLGALVDG